MHLKNYLRLLQIRRGGMLAPDTGAGGGTGGQQGAQGAQEGQQGTQGAQEGAGAQQGAQGAQEGQQGAQTFTQEQVNAILARERAKAERAQKQAVTDAVTEAQRLAKMTAEERAKEEARQREEDYQKRLAELNRRELEAQVRQTLAEKGIPERYAQFINMSSAENANASIDALEKEWKADIERAKADKAREMIGASAGAPGTGVTGGVPVGIAGAVSDYYSKK